MNDYLRWVVAMLKADTTLLPCSDMLAKAMPTVTNCHTSQFQTHE
ncbi:MAG: hypothetical protein ABI583_03630 [Betaproteobacteria bacterium]